MDLRELHSKIGFLIKGIEVHNHEGIPIDVFVKAGGGELREFTDLIETRLIVDPGKPPTFQLILDTRLV